ncbi:MAG: zinc ribbon domain-containing protein [Terriglobia bacterium]
MPIFEYQCRKCGSRFERVVTSADAPTTCKECGSARVEKLLSVFATIGGSKLSAAAESGPCGACGAPRRGMCGE